MWNEPIVFSQSSYTDSPRQSYPYCEETKNLMKDGALMIKVGDIVKLKNPKKREGKRRWRVTNLVPKVSPIVGNIPVPVVDTWGTTNQTATEIIAHPDSGDLRVLRRLDTATRRLEQIHEHTLAPISLWERIWKRY